MKNRGVLTKVLAIIGTVLIWSPIMAPVLFALVWLIRARQFRFDYLMPAELFPVVLVGGCLLLWADLRSRSHQKLIPWGLGIAAGMLVFGQTLADVTGLASGETEPAGWPWVTVLASLAVFWLAVIAVGVGGLMLLRDLFAPPM